MKNIFIYKKIDSESENLASTLTEKLLLAGFNVEKTFTPQTDMTIVVGGDGAFLKAVRATNFSAKPILGINNGHLGFFADFEASELDEVVEVCKTENYIIQKHKVIQTIVNGCWI